MSPERDGQNIWFSAAEAADVLGLTRQAVYAAISAGHLQAKKTASGYRVDAESMLGYGIKTGKDPQVLLNRTQQETGAPLEELVRFALVGVGLYLLVKTLFGKE